MAVLTAETVVVVVYVAQGGEREGGGGYLIAGCPLLNDVIQRRHWSQRDSASSLVVKLWELRDFKLITA